MGFFRRLWNILRGNANAALERIEDPERALDVSIEDMSREIAEFRRRVASSLVDEKRLVSAFEANVAKTDEWGRRAEAAVRSGDDDLAREALRQKAAQAELARASYDATQQHTPVVAQLKDSLRDLTLKLDDAKRRRNVLVARVRNAKAKKKMAEAMGSTGGDGAFARFDALEDKVALLEAESDVALEMGSEIDPGGGRDLERRFAALKMEDPAIEDALRRIKERSGPGRQPELGPAPGGGSALMKPPKTH